MLANRLALIPRAVLLNAVRKSHDHHIQWQGKNLFFNIHQNHRLFALKFALFFAVPFWIPFLNLRFQMKKASGQ